MSVNCFFPTLDSKQNQVLEDNTYVPPHVGHHSVVKTNTIKRRDACQHADEAIIILCVERLTLPRKKCCGFLKHFRQEAGVQHGSL